MVVAIIAIVGATTIPVGSRFLVQSNFKNKTNELVASLRTAQINSFSGKGANSWGVKTTSSQIILFKGTSYALRDSAFDQIFSIPSNITFTQTEIVFNKLTGNPSPIASIVINSSIGNNTISVNEVGAVNVN